MQTNKADSPIIRATASFLHPPIYRYKPTVILMPRLIYEMAHFVVLSCTLAVATLLLPRLLHASDGENRDHLGVVRAYADTMLEKGRDRYGSIHSPLFAEALDRETLDLLGGDRLQRVAAIERREWGLRPHDRMLGGANPQHCQNLFQILYALTDVTSEQTYAREADRSLRWFLEHCQNPETGLFYWGEHAGWDLREDMPGEYASGTTHEFFRPWILWQRCWKLSAGACRRFAIGLWEHQVADHETGDYSRHAAIDRSSPRRGSPYPRHGGFYVLTWAEAYRQTEDRVFLEAIQIVVDGLERDRLGEGLVVSRDRKSGTRRPYDVSLAISLDAAAKLLPQDFAGKLQDIALRHDMAAAAEFKETRKRSDASGNAQDAVDPTNLWSSGYGSFGGEIAGSANVRLQRYRQSQADHYRAAAIAVADRYLTSEIDLSFPVHPGTVGKVIWLLAGAYEITDDPKYLDRANHFADRAFELFFGDGCPLPKATHTHNHYEAICGGDTLMMALLKLWAVQQQPARKLDLIYTDR